jgi:hypothetical protein
MEGPVAGAEAERPLARIERAGEVAGVRAAVPIIEAVVSTTDVSQGNILILGVDMTGDRTMRDYSVEGNDEEITDPLVFLAQPDSLMISNEFAVRNLLKEGDTITLVTPLGNKTFTIRGIMAPKGMAKAFGGNMGIMDIYAAQFVFSRGRFFDRVDIALDEGIKTDDVRASVQSKLGTGFKVEPPLRRGKQTESLMEAFAMPEPGPGTPSRHGDPMSPGETPPPELRESGEELQAVAILFDLTTRDGRKAVEVRGVSPLANGWSASARATLYSCAYSTQKERILALQRARAFCDVRARKVVHFTRAENKHAAWQ